MISIAWFPLACGMPFVLLTRPCAHGARRKEREVNLIFLFFFGFSFWWPLKYLLPKIESMKEQGGMRHLLTCASWRHFRAIFLSPPSSTWPHIFVFLQVVSSSFVVRVNKKRTLRSITTGTFELPLVGQPRGLVNHNDSDNRKEVGHQLAQDSKEPFLPYSSI